MSAGPYIVTHRERRGTTVVSCEAVATLEEAQQRVKSIAKCASCPDDRPHRALRHLDLAVAGCEGSSCQQRREHVVIGSSRVGQETDAALAAMRAGSERQQLSAAIDALPESGGTIAAYGIRIEVEATTDDRLYGDLASMPPEGLTRQGLCERWTREVGTTARGAGR